MGLSDGGEGAWRRLGAKGAAWHAFMVAAALCVALRWVADAAGLVESGEFFRRMSLEAGGTALATGIAMRVLAAGGGKAPVGGLLVGWFGGLCSACAFALLCFRYVPLFEYTEGDVLWMAAACFAVAACGAAGGVSAGYELAAGRRPFPDCIVRRRFAVAFVLLASSLAMTWLACGQCWEQAVLRTAGA